MQIDEVFGGPDSEAQNALRTALKLAAANAGHGIGDYADYELLEKTPRATLVVLIIKALGELGYKVVKHV